MYAYTYSQFSSLNTCITLSLDALFVSTQSGYNVDQLMLGIEHMMLRLKEMLIERGAIVKKDMIDEMKTNMGV
jgi:hypothetical protein